MIWRCDLVPQYKIYKREINSAIKNVLLSGRYILSGQVKLFEKNFAEYIGTKYATGVANATDGLSISLRILNIGKGDEVITTPFTAIPTISAIIDVGATPVFVDVEENTYLMDISKIKKKITKRTKAIIPVHIFGNVLNISEIRNLTDNIPIIEDAAQAHGSKMHNFKAGSMGDISVFSFYPTKNLGGYGDGGIILTNNEKYDKKAKLLRSYGMVDYNHIIINGVNSRLDELQAAILNVKLKFLDDMNKKRNILVNNYKSGLNKEYFCHQQINANVFSNCHVFATKYKGNRKKLISYLDSKGIQTNIYYLMPVYSQKANKFLNILPGNYPVVEKLCKEVIALPLYPELNLRVQRKIIKTINEFFTN